MTQPNEHLFYPLFVPAGLALILAGFVLLRVRTWMSIIFSFICISVSVWTFALALFGLDKLEHAYYWNVLFIVSAAFIPPTFVHFIYLFTKSVVNRVRLILTYIPAFMVMAIMVIHPELFISGVVQRSWGKESLLGPAYVLYGLYFLFCACWGLLKIFKKILSSTGVDRDRSIFVLWATAPSLALGGFFDLFLILMGNYRYIWLGPYFTFCFILVMAYAIVRYRLMDIRLAVTRAGIFFTVYLVVLGVPVWLGFKMLGSGAWIWPVTLMGVLATIGPSIFIFLQRRAEERLLAEQKRYQQVLRQASAGMGHIRELDRLYKLIAHILTRTVMMESAVIYAYDDDKKIFGRVACRFRKGVKNDFLEFKEDSLLVRYLLKLNNRIFIDEVRFLSMDSKHVEERNVESLLNAMEASLVFGIFIENRLDTFVVMGAKASHQPYTEDDLAVFSILTNQAALAIENARFYENVRKTQEQLFRAEKMATIGTMADGVSHQINNRFHAMGFIAGDMLDTLSFYEKDPGRFKIEDVLDEVRVGLKRVEENVAQGSQVVKGLLDYSRNDTKTEKEGVDLHKLLKASLDMVSLKVHLNDFERVIDIPLDVPRVVGNFVQLQEVFFNIIDNAHFSMMDKKTRMIDADYKPCMTFSSEVVAEKLHLTVKDNGLGIKDEDQKKLFTPFFTTKVSSRKGNGLGLYVMRKIIEEDHGGTVRFSSEHLKGVSIEIVLPVLKS